MIRTYCDRCGEEAEANTFKVFCCREIGGSEDEELDLCENCAEALKRFLGIGSDEYETLESEDRKANEVSE